MQHFHVRVRVTEDGHLIGDAPGVPAGEHDAELILHGHTQIPPGADARAAIQALQDELARLPVLDARAPDALLGYDESGLFGSW